MEAKSEVPRGVTIADSASETSEDLLAEVSSNRDTPHEVQPQRTETYDACLAELRKTYASGPQHFLLILDRLGWRLGLAPASAGAGAFVAMTGLGIRVGLVSLATALAGQWTGIPWGRWAMILGFYVLLDITATLAFPPSEVSRMRWYMRVVDDWTAMFSTISKESDLRDLAGFTRSMNRMSTVSMAGVSVAAIMLLACWTVAPTALRELPPGSLVLLALLLFDFGALPIWSNILVNWASLAREARYDHHLFWPSPADSPEVQQAMRRTVGSAFLAGMWTTIFLILTVVLASWDSPLVLPLAVGFLLIGYVSAIGLAVTNRSSVRRIVERSRRQRLQGLQRPIVALEPRYTDLSPEELERLQGLLLLHDRIRDAPVAPSATHTVLRTAAGLLVPTIAFIITVFGEVSAERLLDAILP